MGGPIVAKPTDEELTPPEVWKPILAACKRSIFDIDPCSHPMATLPAKHRICPPDDGLPVLVRLCRDQLVWCNPPYSAPASWIATSSKLNAVMLISGDTSTAIWEKVIWPRATAVAFWYGRIRFTSPHDPERKNDAKRSSAVVFFGDSLVDPTPLESLARIIVP